MTDTDLDILMKKLDSLEEKIDRLEKDIQEIKPKYSPPTTENIQKLWDEITNPTYIAGVIPCMVESLPQEYKNNPTGLVCRCPKCTPYSMNTKLTDCVSTTYLPTPPTTEYIGGKKK